MIGWSDQAYRLSDHLFQESDNLSMVKKKALPKSWGKSKKHIRAVQVVFELGIENARAIRQEASARDLSFSDLIRDIVGLNPKQPVRPRFSVSLSDEDYAQLAKRYGVSADDRATIREKMKEELTEFHKEE